MLGDTDSDVQAGQTAGCRTVLIEYPLSAHKRLGRASPDLRAADLAEGVAQLLDHDSR
jgi:phosphoglycolate phosphatase-like HAD superfamily hydrolase